MPSWTAEELPAQRDWLQSLAARLVRDESERDDLVQEAWLAALRRPGRAGDLRRWLGGVVRMRWRFARRSEGRRLEREQRAASGADVPSAAELAEGAELQRALVGAVLALDEPQRSTVLLRYFGGLTSRAIARREGVPEGTVRSRLKRALDQLRSELDREHGGERRAWVLALVPLARVREGSALPAWSAAAALLALVGLGAWGLLAWRAQPASATSATAPAVVLASAPENAHDPSTPSRREELAPTGDSSSASLETTDGLVLLVLDEENHPIPGATISCVESAPALELATDEQGRARLPDDVWSAQTEVWSAPYVQLRIEAPGFVHLDRAFQRGEVSWSSPQPVCLVHAFALEGRLIDEDTTLPIEGAEFLLWHDGCDRPLARTTSAADGSFRLEPAPRGYQVEVETVARAPGDLAGRRNRAGDPPRARAGRARGVPPRRSRAPGSAHARGGERGTHPGFPGRRDRGLPALRRRSCERPGPRARFLPARALVLRRPRRAFADRDRRRRLTCDRADLELVARAR